MIIYKDFEFEMSHRLDGYNGACNNIHGHTYKLTIGAEVKELDELGIGIDFKSVKSIVNTRIINIVDHAIWLKDCPGNKELIELCDKKGWKRIKTKFNPTAENMSVWMWELLKDMLNMYTLTLWETSTSRVTLNKNNFDSLQNEVLGDIVENK